LDLPTKRDFGLAELRVVRSDDEITHHRHLAAAAQCIARDRSHDRLSYLAHLLPADGDEVLQEDVLVRLVLHLLDVCTGSESFFASREHDAADVGVGLERIERLTQLTHEIGAQRIQRFRPVQPNDADPAFCLGLDIFVGDGHAFLLWLLAS